MVATRMLHFVQLVGWAAAHLQLLTWSQMSHCVTLSLPFSQPTPPNHHSSQPATVMSNFISKMLLLATDYHRALTAASNVAMATTLFLLFALYYGSHITSYDIQHPQNHYIQHHHDIHPALSSKWAATLLAFKLAPVISLPGNDQEYVMWDHQPQYTNSIQN